MELIDIDKTNLNEEHICCAIADKSMYDKKNWMQRNIPDGLVFTKANVRGKVFIEYMPTEKAWAPVNADNYMHINCFWVSGQYKGKGIANQLLNSCINNAKAQKKLGLVVLSSTKKKPFLSDPDYLKYKGFLVADTTAPYYELLYLPFDTTAPIPKFKPSVIGMIEQQEPTIFYTNQCPHAEKYANLLKPIAKKHGYTLNLIKFKNYQEAQNSPAPFATYSFFHKGKFVTNEILSEKKFAKFLEAESK